MFLVSSKKLMAVLFCENTNNTNKININWHYKLIKLGGKHMKILVLLTCYNRKEKTLKCLETLRKDNQIDFEFIVVDDNSNDGTFEELKKLDYVKVIQGDGSLFYSGGMRIAIDTAKKMQLNMYDFVMLINDDVEFFDNSISKLILFLNNENAIVIGSMCDKNSIFSYGGSIKTSKFRPSYKNVMSTTEKRVYCDTFCANCVLIPVKIFVKLDNIDSVYRHAMGDFDYGCCAVKKGYRIVASDFFVGKCDDNSIKGTWRDTKLSRRARIKLMKSPKGLITKEWFYYLKKNHGILTAVIYSCTPYIRILVKK